MSAASSAAEPPVADRVPHVWDRHGVQRADDYAWMATDKPRLVPYLVAEREHYDAVMAPTRQLQETLFEEMAARLSPADESVAWSHGEWSYFDRSVAGKEYRQFCRRPRGEHTADPQVLLDLNELAAASAYLALGVREVSPDNTLLAYSIDTDGDEVYQLRIKDMAIGHDLPDVIARSYYGCAWAASGAAVYYTVHDEAYRPYVVMRHRIGSDPAADEVVFTEPDERFEVEVKTSRSGELIVISVRSGDTSEVRVMSALDDDATEPMVVAARRTGVQYAVEHVPGDAGGDLYVVTNDGADEFRLMRAPLHASDVAAWTEVVAGTASERLVGVDAFAGHLIVSLRRDGLTLLRVMDLATGATREIGAEIPAGTIRLSCRDDERAPVLDPFDATSATVVIESLVEPPSWWTVDLRTGDRRRLKSEPVPGYDAGHYRTARLSVPTPDGAEVPLTVAYRHDLPQDGTAPCLLYGYGAYEACIDPYFDPQFASLLDRGTVYGIAHIRGGGEGGRNWWDQGKLRHKRNTFTDFIAAADYLADQGWVDGDRIASRGASAGGLLQGAALSIAPQRWRAVVAEVPFVDVVTTMLDASLPLTASEWREWGDPRQADDFTYMLSYSPYDIVPTGPRPHLLATGSLHDSRVMIHEPAKWVAKLRATAAGDHSGGESVSGGEVLFRAEVGSASHGGPSGRYDRLRYQAEILAFVLTRLGVG